MPAQSVASALPIPYGIRIAIAPGIDIVSVWVGEYFSNSGRISTAPYAQTTADARIIRFAAKWPDPTFAAPRITTTVPANATAAPDRAPGLKRSCLYRTANRVVKIGAVARIIAPSAAPEP